MELDKEIALAVIVNGGSDKIYRHLGQFERLDKEVAMKLIEAGKGFMVGQKPDCFHDMDEELVVKLFESGNGSHVLQDRDDFPEIKLDKAIALKLIKSGQGGELIFHADEFKGLDSEVALELLRAGEIDVFANCYRSFRNLNAEVALSVIKTGKLHIVGQNIKSFSGLNKEVALALIKEGWGYSVEDDLDLFDGLDKDKIKEFCNKFSVKIDEAILLMDEKIGEEQETDIEEQFKSIYKVLKKHHHGWEDVQNIIGPFEAGAGIFGYEKIFRYLNRDHLNRHDGLHNFAQILEMYNFSGLKDVEFYNNILQQVSQDDARYYEGSAQNHLNSLAGNTNFDLAGVQEKLQKYSEIDKLQNLANELGSTKNIFASWKNLKKYNEICELLGRTEILDKLKKVREQGKEKLYKYIETLAFHPNISMEMVFKFFDDPNTFLGLRDDHTPEEAHDRKKPSNYVHIPYLDLTAEELRDALVEGHYDALQVFSPMEIDYKINSEEKINLREQLGREIGVRDPELRKKLGIEKEEKLQNNPKLFAKLSKIFKARGFDLKKYLHGDIEITEAFSDELQQFKRPTQFDEYRAKINRKSDPDGVVAGNDTACCMPFGSGKNNVYTFNPVCALFTVQRKNKDGTFRTVAQSVLTPDKDIGKNISEVIEAMHSEEAQMHEILDENILINSKSIIACDNIEVSENFTYTDDYEKILKDLYCDFFKEYVARQGEEKNLDLGWIIIGKGHSDAFVDLPTVDNTYAPEAPVGYSDNFHTEAYKLDLKSSDFGFIRERKVIIEEAERKKKEEVKLPQGISPLTFRDSLSVSYLEGKAYQDNEDLIQYLHNMENALIAKDVSNEYKSRQNISYKYQDDMGKVQGYILAYEGRKDGNEIIYVSDLAANTQLSANKKATKEVGTTIGQQLVRSFLKEYKKNYVDKERLIPIYAQLRERTSYKLLSKHFEQFEAEIGINFEVDELGTYDQGSDVMHEVIIRPI